MKRLLVLSAFLAMFSFASAEPLKVGDPAPQVAAITETGAPLAFADAYRMLNNRISIFVSLPLRSLDRLTLQGRLREIGRDLPKAG